MWKTYPFWGMSCKAFSLLRKKAPIPTPKDELVSGMPLWHSTWFRDTHENTYYSPAMMRRGVQMVAQMEAPGGRRLLLALSPTQAPTIHPRDGDPLLLAELEQARHALVSNGTNAGTPAPATRGVVGMAQTTPPLADREFIQTTLWKKLTLGVRLANWPPAGTACPILRAIGNHATCSDGVQILFGGSTRGDTMHGPGVH